MSIFKLLNGTISATNIIDSLSEFIPQSSAFFYLMQLKRHGFIIEKNDQKKHTPKSIAYRSTNSNKESSLEISFRVHIVDKKENLAIGRNLVDKLNHSSCKEENKSNSEINLVLVDDYLDPRISQLANDFSSHNLKWMPIKPFGEIAWIGPIFSAKNTSWTQFLSYLKNQRPYHSRLILDGELDWINKFKSFSKGSLNTCFDLVLKYLLDYQSTQNDDIANLLITHNYLSSNTNLFPITIGNLADNPKSIDKLIETTIDLNPSLITNTHDAGSRVISPDKTLKKLKNMVNPFVGPITRVTKADLPPGFHVYSAIYNRPMFDPFDFEQTYSLKESAAGKGATDEQAEVSCIAEAIERYCSWYRGGKPDLVTKFSNIEDIAVSPSSLIHFSENQYRNRESWNSQHIGFNWIPMKFDLHKSIHWTRAWSITHEEFRYVPSAYCYFDYPLPKTHCFYRGDSNGCASGNNIVEAILQGVFEIVERDAASIWWYNKLRRQAIEIESLQSSYIVRMKESYESMRRKLELLDITSDLQIPTIAAVSWDQEGRNIHIGLGCHTSIKIAATRAVTEMNQMYWCALYGQNESSSWINREMGEWYNFANIETESYIVPNGWKNVGEFRDTSSEVNLAKDLSSIVTHLELKGMEVIVLDLSIEGLPLNVVRVIIPEARHFWSRLGSGRLYDVPVKMGLQNETTSELEMNAIPLFL